MGGDQPGPSLGVSQPWVTQENGFCDIHMQTDTLCPPHGEGTPPMPPSPACHLAVTQPEIETTKCKLKCQAAPPSLCLRTNIISCPLKQNLNSSLNSEPTAGQGHMRVLSKFGETGQYLPTDSVTQKEKRLHFLQQANSVKSFMTDGRMFICLNLIRLK